MKDNTKKSKDTYYFSHDSNALSDPKILSMRCDYELERIRFILGNSRNVKKRNNIQVITRQNNI